MHYITKVARGMDPESYFSEMPKHFKTKQAIVDEANKMATVISEGYQAEDDEKREIHPIKW